MNPIPPDWIKNYIDKLLEVAGGLPEDSRMRNALLHDADVIMNMVQAWKEGLGYGANDDGR